MERAIKIKINRESLVQRLLDIPCKPHGCLTYGSTFVEIVADELQTTLKASPYKHIGSAVITGIPTEAEIECYTFDQPCLNFIKRELKQEVKFQIVQLYDVDELDVTVDLTKGTASIAAPVATPAAIKLFNQIRLHR